MMRTAHCLGVLCCGECCCLSRTPQARQNGGAALAVGGCSVSQASEYRPSRYLHDVVERARITRAEVESTCDQLA